MSWLTTKESHLRLLFQTSRHKLLKYHYHCLYQRTDCHICFLCFLICRSLSYFLGLTSIHKTEIFQQKGLGVSHNSPQADKVLPWSIQLSKYKYQKGIFLFSFQFALTGILFFKKVKEVKLPFTLRKGRLTSLVTKELNFFDKFLQLL